MKTDPTSIFSMMEDWLKTGRATIGEILVQKSGEGFQLCHLRDENSTADLVAHDKVTDARDIGRYTANGEYRPLKTAPTLKRGWMLKVDSLAALREALDYFYPGALGLWNAHQSKTLEVTPLRGNLNRQTGMYRFARTVTDTGAQQQILRTCHEGWGCLRRITWPISEDVPVRSLPEGQVKVEPEPAEISLLCPEACPILVSQIRKVAKREAEARKRSTVLED